MSDRRPPVLVIGGGSANGLGIGWNLQPRGIPVYCVTSNPQELMRFSKHCTGAAVVAKVERDPPILKRFLRAFQRQHPGPSVLFPTSDTALLTVAQIREVIAPSVTFLPSRELVETMVIKSRFYHSLRKWQVPHPRTVLSEDSEKEQLAQQLDYPVFLRPTQSLPFHAQFRRKGFVAYTPREVQQYVQLAARHRLEVMVQEIIPGPASDGFIIRGYLDQQSQPIVVFASQKVRQPSTFSINTVKVSVPLSQVQDGLDILLPYLQGIQYHGLFGAEFKRDPRDGVCKLLEINARSQGGNFFTTQCGVNDILAAYQEALGYPVTPVTRYSTGVYAINLFIDAVMLLRYAVTGRLASHHFLPYLRPHHFVRLVHTDPLPFFNGLQTYFQDLQARRH